MYASYQPPIGETKAWSVVKTGHEFFKAATACFHMQGERHSIWASEDDEWLYFEIYHLGLVM
ncbi:hypothetical protein NC651_025636 [Populus alba x Populus x berolinensis]|nr:hypothetical protein NC651_025636 [Populus alba x Populus x berolinensis]